MKCLLSIIAALVLLCGCNIGMLNQFNDNDGVQVPVDKGVVSITLPGNQSRAATQADVGSYVVVLTGIDVPYNNGITGLPGESLRFENLVPGNYTVSVDAYDAPDPELPESNMIFTGSIDVTVLAGQVTTATVQLQFVNGDIEVEIVFPDQPGDGNTEPDPTEQLDQAQTEVRDIHTNQYNDISVVFTAGKTGELIKIDLYLADESSGNYFDNQIYLELYDGERNFDAQLGQSGAVVVQSAHPDGWYTFEFSGVYVTSSNKYTFLIKHDYPLCLGGYENASGEDIYPNGYSSWLAAQQIWDIAFRSYVRQ